MLPVFMLVVLKRYMYINKMIVQEFSVIIPSFILFLGLSS